MHHDGEGFAAVAVGRGVVHIGVGAAALRDDGLALGQQVVANVYCLVQQAARVLAQIKHQALEVAEAVDGIFHLVAGGFLELREMDVADAGTNFILEIDGGMGNFVANEIEDQRLGLAVAHRGDFDLGSLGALERLRHLVRGPAVGGFAVDCDDLVAGMNAGAEGGRVLIGRDDEDLGFAVIVLLLDDHADAVVVAALIFAEAGVGLGIVEVRVRVEHLQHAGDGAVVDGVIGLVAGDGLGVVLLYERIDISKGLEAVTELALVLRGLRADAALQDGAGNGTDHEEHGDKEERATGAGSHRQTEPPDGLCGRRGSQLASIESESCKLQDRRSIKIDLARFRQGQGDARTARETPAEPSWAKV